MRVKVGQMPTNEERLAETLSFRVTRSLYEYLNSLAIKDRRKLSEIATALIERGIVAYKRDGHLFEPQDNKLGVIRARTEEVSRKRKP